jgi:hypothetical protein
LFQFRPLLWEWPFWVEAVLNRSESSTLIYCENFFASNYE